MEADFVRRERMVEIPSEITGVDAETVAAVAAGKAIQRITYLSGSTVAERHRWFPMVAQKLAAEEALRHPGWDPDVWVRRIAGELFSSPALVQILSQRMMAISEWLLLAGEERLSRLALVTAQAMLDRDASELPFVRALVRRDLDAALRSLKPDSEE